MAPESSAPPDDDPNPAPELRRRTADQSERPRSVEDETPTQYRVPAALRTTAPIALPIVVPAPAARRPCLLVLAGPRVGELIPIEGHLLIGRDASAGLQIIDEGVSRRHARVSAEGGDVQLIDLDSTNGTWMEGQRVSSHALREGERFRVGQTTVVKFSWQDPSEEQYQRQLLETALRDNLTHAFNERYFRERLGAEAAYAERHRAPLAVLLANADRFEHINRVHGRAAGDRLLARLAEVIQGAVRTDDVLARLESDTFGLLARETGLDGGMRLGDRLRGVVADALFEVDTIPVEIRVSVGVSAFAGESPQTAEALLEQARAALASAKEGGRNRVAIDEHAPSQHPDDPEHPEHPEQPQHPQHP